MPPGMCDGASWCVEFDEPTTAGLQMVVAERAYSAANGGDACVGKFECRPSQHDLPPIPRLPFTGHCLSRHDHSPFPPPLGPDLDAMLPTRGFLFDLEGQTRDPCEAQFGAFACAPKSFLGHELPGYDLIYQEGCDSVCSFDSCTVSYRTTR